MTNGNGKSGVALKVLAVVMSFLAFSGVSAGVLKAMSNDVTRNSTRIEEACAQLRDARSDAKMRDLRLVELDKLAARQAEALTSIDRRLASIEAALERQQPRAQ